MSLSFSRKKLKVDSPLLFDDQPLATSFTFGAKRP
jgi:hypothetical protein